MINDYCYWSNLIHRSILRERPDNVREFASSKCLNLYKKWHLLQSLLVTALFDLKLIMALRPGLLLTFYNPKAPFALQRNTNSKVSQKCFDSYTGPVTLGLNHCVFGRQVF